MKGRCGNGIIPLIILVIITAKTGGMLYAQETFHGASFLYQIKQYNGAPTLFINGSPSFYGTYWLNAPTNEGWIRSDFARKDAPETDVHIYAFDVGALEWTGPGENRKSQFDFSTVEERFNYIIHADPEARFHLRIYLEMNERHRQWWHDIYPEELEVVSNGTKDRQSFASKVWREQAKQFLREYIAHIKKIGMADRILAYQVGAGHTGEWVKGKVSMSFHTGDYSAPMRRHFRSWLRKKYNNEETALQRAWNDPEVTFESAEVPSAKEQFNTEHWTFRDPQKEQNVIDYYMSLSELCGDLVIDFCETVKNATGGKSLAGAFYGYLMELTWNAGFFGEGGKGSDSDYSTYQRSGHLGLKKVLNSPYVDFLVSPYSYGFRGIGGEGCSMPPAESMRIHNKIYLFEDDTRTHTHEHPAYGRARNLSESTAILKRNFAYITTKGQGIWWLVNKGHIISTLEPAFRPLLKQFKKLGEFTIHTDRSPCAEIAVLLDDESFFYETIRNDLDMPLIFKQHLIGLPRMGAPYDVYLLDDFLNGKLKPYKLYIFLNPLRLNESRRLALKRELYKDGKTALWIYAPGYLNDTASVENIRDVTGFNMEENEHPWASFMHVTNFNHTITREIPQDFFWGSDSRLGPQFFVNDKYALELGQVVFAQGTCKPGLVVKKFPEWKSVYCSVPNVPAQILRGIARYAGVHIYNDKGDVLYASKNLFSVHTVAGGERLFILPEKVEVIYDLFNQRIVDYDTDTFNVTLAPASTVLFYTGNKSILSNLDVYK